MNDDKDYLYERLVKLGDLMADGIHLEPDGAWIEKEYKDTMRLIGISPVKKKRKSPNNTIIDEFMKKRCCEEICECGGELVQTRKGSFFAKCKICEKKYRLGKSRRN